MSSDDKNNQIPVQNSKRSLIENAADAVVAMESEYASGYRVAAHTHSRSQLLHALTGVVTVSTAQGRWMVPPDHAMWIPAGIEHSVTMLGHVHLRSAYLRADTKAVLADRLCVLAMTDLMRTLVAEVAMVGVEDTPTQRSQALIELILHEVSRLPERPFALPLPSHPKLEKLCRDFLAMPTPHVTIDDWAHKAGMSRRAFTRLFLRETGLSLSVWRRQATLFAALPRLAEGVPVTVLALDLGYESTPAFTTMFRRMLGVSPRAYLKGR